ncbi:MAG: hypothetical protein EA382_06170 [Spirochaetaceae bacterium]|nr:MAG: hypothetical protein EA382_06170 [Spirochaetaceae bacterium]
MDKGCLITGKSTDLLAEVVQTTVATGRKTIVARSGHFTVDDETASTVVWNRRSALSARSVVLHARNAFRSLPEAVVVYSVTQESIPFHDSSIVSVEDRTDAEIKGYLFLLRELVALFQKQRSGRLILAVHDVERQIRSPLEAFSIGGFTSFAEALSRFYQNEPFEIRLCHSSSPDVSGFARFIVDALDAPRPRKPRLEWSSYPSRGLFGVASAR